MLLLLQYIAIISACSEVMAPFYFFCFSCVMQAMLPLKTFLNCEVFLHLYLLFYYNFATALIVRAGMPSSINLISILHTTVTVVFSENPTSPFTSATPISCYRGIISLLSEYIFATLCDFFSVHALKQRHFCFVPSPSCSATMISYKGDKIGGFDNVI